MPPAPANVQDIYELSPLQLGMLFHTLYAPNTGVYLEQVVYHLPGKLNRQAFDAAWQALAEAHPILRTSFFWEDLSKPLQIVYRNAQVPVEHHDWTGLNKEERDLRLDAHLKADGERGFDISIPPLLRVACFEAEQSSEILLSFHHALLDGWSLQLLMSDLSAAYAARCWGRLGRVPTRRPYSDYIGWLQSQDLQAAERFWRAALKGFCCPSPLNIDTLPADEERTAAFGEVESWVAAETTQKLEDYARSRKLTINTIVQGAWALLLSRYSGEADVLFGTVVSGRPAGLGGAEEMIGLFINSLAVRIATPGSMNVDEWLRGIQERGAEARRFEYSPLTQVQGWSEVPRDLPLFETVLVFENYPFAQEEAPAGNEASARHIERTNLPLTLLIVPGKRLRIKILFDAQKFDRPVIARLAGHFERILAEIAEERTTLDSIRMTGPDEVQLLVHDWNDRARRESAPWSIAGAFEDIVAANESALALISGGTTLSYGALNAQVNRLAKRLLSAGAGQQFPIAVCLGRSIEGAASLLAVLKLNAVYVPMDPAYPAAVLREMVEAAGARFVLVRKALAPCFEGSEAVTILVEDEDLEETESYAGPRPVIALPQDLMYIVFTSGSTGRPKAIAAEHAQVLNRLEWMWREYPFAPGEIACNKTSPSFVDHIWELLGGLLKGIPTVVVADEQARNLEALIDILAAGKVSRLWLVPSLLRSMLQFDDLSYRLPALKFWVSSGEPLPPDLFQKFNQVMAGAILYNLYGTSEVWDATWFDPEVELKPYCGQIGRPIQNVRTYILMDNGDPAPIGVPGELCIGGPGVARGYVGAPEDARFADDPFASGRMYRTGDICRFFADGNIQFLGRRDHQVKVRGQRIDLCHVESIMAACPGVLNAGVILQNGDGEAARLVAYLSAASGAQLNVQRLRNYARERLPAALRPSGYALIDTVPLTVSGKVDRANLAECGRVEELADRASRPPQTDAERQLEALFKEVLCVGHLGVDDNFFTDLGGNSLLATRLVSRIREAFATELPLRQFFESPTVEQIAALVEDSPAIPGTGPISRQPRAGVGAEAQPGRQT